MLYLLFTLIGFVSGGMMFSYYLPLLIKRVDIVALSADRNPGTSNAFIHAGKPIGILCLILDMSKGFLPVFLAFGFLDCTSLLFSAVILSPILGHAVAPFNKFKGGKAIAVSFGVLCALMQKSLIIVALIILYLFFSIVYVINPHEKRSVVTFVLFALFCAASIFFGTIPSVALGCILISAVTIVKNLALPSKSGDSLMSKIQRFI